jgi:hypothetical protein
MIKGQFTPLIIVMLFSTFLLSGCNEPQLKSAWSRSSLHESQPEFRWDNSTTYSLEGKNVILGLQNDEDYLYILLKAADQNTERKFTRGGLIIWLNNTGEKKKSFGIHFPLGFQFNKGEGGPPPMNGQWPNQKPDRGSGEFGPPPAVFDSMEIIGPGVGEQIKVPAHNDLGLTVSRRNNSGTISYEFVIPLKSTNGNPYAVGARTGDIIGFGLETGQSNRPSMKEDRNEKREAPDGGRGGNFGGRGGFGNGGDTYGDDGSGSGGGPRGFGGRDVRGGQRGGDIPERGGAINMDPIKFWAKIELSKPPAQ